MKVIDRWHRRANGEPKVSYESAAEAKAANPKALKIYLCATCNKFHVAYKGSKRNMKRLMQSE